MSAFDDMFAATAVPALMGLFKAAGTYIDLDGVETAVELMAGSVAEDLIYGPDQREAYSHRAVQIPLATVSDPALRARVVIDGLEWTIWEQLGRECGLARVRVVRPVRVEDGGRRGR